MASALFTNSKALAYAPQLSESFDVIDSSEGIKNGIDNPQQTFIPVYDEWGDLSIATQIFSESGQYYYVVTSPITHETTIKAADELFYLPPEQDLQGAPLHQNWETLKGVSLSTLAESTVSLRDLADDMGLYGSGPAINSNDEAYTDINDYRETFMPVYDADNNLFVAIRSFTADGKYKYLLVDPFTLDVSVQPESEVHYRPSDEHPDNPVPPYTVEEELEATPYRSTLATARDIASEPAYPIQQGGIEHALGDVDGMFITVDMDPSRREWSKDFFEDLINIADVKGSLHRLGLA